MSSTDHLSPERLRAAVPSEHEQRHLASCVRCRAERRMAVQDGAGATPVSADSPWILGRWLWSGGMGVVYEARHAVLGTRHAVKVLRVADPMLRARLLREGRLQARLVHPNIVPIEAVVEIDGAPALVMPFVDGPTLDRVLAQHRLPQPVALAVFRAVATGVAEIHRARLVHRDIKPQNVLLERLSDEVIPRVSDFGLAKVFAATEPSLQTGTGAMLGTPAYAAPEQLVDAASAGPPADVYSLGCLLYELLTGRRAFLDIERAALPSLDGVPEPFRDLIARCLASAPGDRPPDAVTLLAALPPHEPAIDLRPWCTGDAPTPALPTLPPMAPALPRQRDRFVGRESELSRIDAQFVAGARGVTLTGESGCGKTRLALQYGLTRGPLWPGGAVWADGSTETAARAVARALGLGRGGVERIGDVLAERGPTLLLLDAPGAPDTAESIARWQARAPELAVLCAGGTSTDVPCAGPSLRIEGLGSEDATALFVARATAARSGFVASPDVFADIIALVARFDRLPLAIELLAARVGDRTVAALRAEVDARLEDRTGTSALLLAWVWEELSEPMRSALSQLSQLSQPFSIDLAESMVDLSAHDDAPWMPDIVQDLCNRALVRSDEKDGQIRMTLHPLVRAFGRP